MWVLYPTCSQGSPLLRCNVTGWLISLLSLWSLPSSSGKMCSWGERKTGGTMEVWTQGTTQLAIATPKWPQDQASWELAKLTFYNPGEDVTSGKSLALSSVKIIDKFSSCYGNSSLAEPLMPYSRDSGCRHQLRVSGWDTGCQISHMFCDIYNRPLKLFHILGHAYTKNLPIDLKSKMSLQQNTRLTTLYSVAGGCSEPPPRC